MAWRVLNEAKIVKDDCTGEVGILTGYGEVTVINGGGNEEIELIEVRGDIYNGVTVPAGEYAEIRAQTLSNTHPLSSGDVDKLLGSTYISTLKLESSRTDLSKLLILSVTSIAPSAVAGTNYDIFTVKVYNPTSEDIVVTGYQGTVVSNFYWTLPSNVVGR